MGVVEELEMKFLEWKLEFISVKRVRGEMVITI
jgi:hypothetical protein